MKLTYRLWILLICLSVSGSFLLQTVTAQPPIQTPQNPRPAILEFSREFCPMCTHMAKVLQQFKAKYGDPIEVRILHYNPDDKLFNQYKVVFVPTQVFLDASGKEVFRHTGIFTIYELVKKLKELKLIQAP